FPLQIGVTAATSADKEPRAKKRTPDRSAGVPSTSLRAGPPAVAGASRPRRKSDPEPALSDPLRIRLFELRQRGFNRLYQNGQIFEFSTPESLLDVDFNQPVFLLVDRLAISPDARARIVD